MIVHIVCNTNASDNFKFLFSKWPYNNAYVTK